MVHGIGQRLQKANLVDDVGDFRRVTASLAERHLSPYQRSTQRVLFIPCQVSISLFCTWRLYAERKECLLPYNKVSIIMLYLKRRAYFIIKLDSSIYTYNT